MIVTLRRAFSLMTDGERANVRHHLEIGTSIVCGKDASIYADGKGGM